MSHSDPSVDADFVIARRVDAAERLTATLSALVAVYSDMRELMEISRARLWTSSELNLYLDLRRHQRELSRRYAVALAQHERARQQVWRSTRDGG